jgi:hypothetical protein
LGLVEKNSSDGKAVWPEDTLHDFTHGLRRRKLLNTRYGQDVPLGVPTVVKIFAEKFYRALIETHRDDGETFPLHQWS